MGKQFISFKYTEEEKFEKAKKYVKIGTYVRMGTKQGLYYGKIVEINETNITIQQNRMTTTKAMDWKYIDYLSVMEGIEW